MLIAATVSTAAGNGIVPPKQPEFWVANPDLAILFGATQVVLPTKEQ
jgi:hypothetical protein